MSHFVVTFLRSVEALLEFHVLQELQLTFGFLFQSEFRATFNGVVVHQLQFFRCLIASKDDLVDPVADHVGPGEQLRIGFELIQWIGVLQERLVLAYGGESNDISADGIDLDICMFDQEERPPWTELTKSAMGS